MRIRLCLFMFVRERLLCRDQALDIKFLMAIF